MCCFTGPIKLVAGTKIFARRVDAAHQALVYAMSVDFDRELAMVLPLPVPVGAFEDALRFVDLSGYPSFFDDMEKAFPPLVAIPAAKSRSFGARPAPQTLVVHEVGDFEASFVPRRAEFARLDPRFRMPEGAWDHLHRYDDFGFAVFKLAPKRGLLGASKRQKVHPMAFVFEARDPDSIFFPTVHVHDGTVPERARFDHALYAQAEGALGATLGWVRSKGPMDEHVDVSRAQGLVADARSGFAMGLFGELSNEDVWLRPPSDLDAQALEGEGDCFRYHLAATGLYAFGAPEDPRAAAWREGASLIARVARAIPRALEDFVSRERASLRLRPLDASLEAHFVNGWQVWRGTSYMDGAPGHEGGAGYVVFRPFTARLEPQRVVLGFERLPDDETTRRIQAALCAMLDRCLDA